MLTKAPQAQNEKWPKQTHQLTSSQRHPRPRGRRREIPGSSRETLLPQRRHRMIESGADVFERIDRRFQGGMEPAVVQRVSGVAGGCSWRLSVETGRVVVDEGREGLGEMRGRGGCWVGPLDGAELVVRRLCVEAVGGGIGTVFGPGEWWRRSTFLRQFCVLNLIQEWGMSH